MKLQVGLQTSIIFISLSYNDVQLTDKFDLANVLFTGCTSNIWRLFKVWRKYSRVAIRHISARNSNGVLSNISVAR